MADKPKKNPDYSILKLEIRKEVKAELVEKQKAAGFRSLAEFLRPVFTKIIKGEI